MELDRGHIQGNLGVWFCPYSFPSKWCVYVWWWICDDANAV